MASDKATIATLVILLAATRTVTAVLTPCPIGQVSPPVRLRGIVQAVAIDTKVTVKQNGKLHTMLLDPDVEILASRKAALDQVGLNTNVAIVAAINPDGSGKASAVGILPKEESVGDEKHWDSGARTKFILGSVIEHEVSSLGVSLTVRIYEKFKRRLFVPLETPVVSIERAGKNVLKKDGAVFVEGAKLPDCKVHAYRVVVGVDGQIPPL